MEQFLKDTIKQAGYLAKGYYVEGIEYTTKSHAGDVVTKADIETSNFLIKKIQEKFPDHGIISEEEDGEINPGAEYTWVMDPIDGTRNFANHISVWCTMIGITKNEVPYMGAIYDALNDELFFAKVGEGAYLNDKKIKVSGVDDLDYFNVVFSAGQIRNDSPYNPEKDALKKYFKFYDNMMGDTGHWVSNYSTSLSLAHLAAGRLDAVVVNCALYHDYLSGYIICKEAGAKFTDVEGRDWKRGRKDVVVANPKLHKKLLKMF